MCVTIISVLRNYICVTIISVLRNYICVTIISDVMEWTSVISKCPAAVVAGVCVCVCAVSQALKENTYPFLGLIVLRDNRMTAVARIEGPIGKWFGIVWSVFPAIGKWFGIVWSVFQWYFHQRQRSGLVCVLVVFSSGAEGWFGLCFSGIFLRGRGLDWSVFQWYFPQGQRAGLVCVLVVFSSEAEGWIDRCFQWYFHQRQRAGLIGVSSGIFIRGRGLLW